MKFLTFAFVINFVLVCWPKLDIISRIKRGSYMYHISLDKVLI